MNKLLIIIIIIYFLPLIDLSGQILPVSLVIQEQNQWCWVAVSKCVLEYYGHTLAQCAIAEYTRTVATWNDFGTQNCCDVPYGACNHANSLWGESGSISDILKHFGNIQIIAKADSLAIREISSELKNARPFIFHWSWTAGGGHYLVGHGIDKEMIYYMNPWPGEGFKIALYDWVVSSSDHKWVNAIELRPNPSAVDDNKGPVKVKVYPNPSKGLITIEMNSEPGEHLIEIVNVFGQIKYSQKFNNLTNKLVINQTFLPDGFYIINIMHNGICSSEKLMINH
jgi:hypothetical protein